LTGGASLRGGPAKALRIPNHRHSFLEAGVPELDRLHFRAEHVEAAVNGPQESLSLGDPLEMHPTVGLARFAPCAPIFVAVVLEAGERRSKHRIRGA
jgi:hypothetical protein